MLPTGVSESHCLLRNQRLTNGKIAISNETRKRVEDAIEPGYEPDARAQALSSAERTRSRWFIPDLRNPHFFEFATGVEDAARVADYQFLLSSNCCQ